MILFKFIFFVLQARQLLVSFPLDTMTKNGPFWQSPKRPPVPIEFDDHNELHFSFIVSAAKLFASVYGIQHSQAVCIYSFASLCHAQVWA